MKTAFPFQKRSIDALAKSDRTLLVAPTGSGKTFMGVRAALLARREGEGPVIWVAPTIDICAQARGAWGEAGGGEGVFIAVCAAGLETLEVAKPSLIILDEGHHYPSQQLITWTMAMAGQGVRVWGLTATPKHRKAERNDIMDGFFTKSIAIGIEEVVASGLVVLPSVWFAEYAEDMQDAERIDREVSRKMAIARTFWLRNAPESELAEYSMRTRWLLSQKAIEEHPRKLKLISDWIKGGTDKEEGWRSTLVICNRVEQAQLIRAGVYGTEARAGAHCIVNAGIGAKTRQKRIQDFRDGKTRLLICTTLADEGLDLPRAERLVLAGAGQSKIKVPQRLGRVMRAHGDKKADVLDFIDRGCPLGLAMSRNRWKMVRELGCEVRMLMK